MNQYSIKMSDGTRYDCKESNLTWWNGEEYLKIKCGNREVWLNERHVVSVTIKGDGDDSKAISKQG